ncbi:unnamed protein product [Caenorhabditis nigoni]|uniref:Uncharacterized protein n=1 Tax=Caenorhabditis nigoni TaxID=1611254 RepID=A0A2G5SCS0_9PELO|nr:hypothetical protein B9Z55_028117 [Caenorhabditis nigoni]
MVFFWETGDVVGDCVYAQRIESQTDGYEKNKERKRLRPDQHEEMIKTGQVTLQFALQSFKKIGGMWMAWYSSGKLETWMETMRILTTDDVSLACSRGYVDVVTRSVCGQVDF